MQVKKLHELKGVTMTSRLPNLTAKALKGRANTQAKTPTRLAVTPDVLWLLKTKLHMANMRATRKKMIWAAATFLFVGSMRAGEILPSSKSTYIRNGTLLNDHVMLVKKKVEGKEVEMLVVHLEAPKEDKTRKGVDVELFRLEESFFCPVHAWKRWREKSKLTHEGSAPVFREEDGRGFTQNELNKVLKELLKSEIDYDQRKISGHSFRAGITTVMAKLGYSQELISLQGRWRSEAYLTYCKLGRANRLKDQLNIMTHMKEVSLEWNTGGVLV